MKRKPYIKPELFVIDEINLQMFALSTGGGYAEEEGGMLNRRFESIDMEDENEDYNSDD